jgi:3-oxoacyl-[acyl-carrier protein] reductase
MEATPDRWIETYQFNVLSGVRMIHRLVPKMREKCWGRVIQIGGGLAIQPIAMQPDYEASLAARHNLAVSLARELKDTGVTSNVVAPGAILVSSVEKLLIDIAPRYGWGNTWEEIERGCVRDIVPNDVGRLGRPEEIAAAVAYLASPHADYVSGAVLRVDGGTIRSVNYHSATSGFAHGFCPCSVDIAGTPTAIAESAPGTAPEDWSASKMWCGQSHFLAESP